MKQIDWKNLLLPHLIAVVVFLALSLAYFSPLISGKILQQGDITQFKGMAQETKAFEQKTGEQSLWTNSMFGGMPTYQISKPKTLNLVRWVNSGLKLGIPRPASYLFVCLLGFYILLVSLRMNPLLSAVGAIAFAFSTYNFLILEAGHNTKFVTIGYMAPVVASVLAVYRGKWLLGGLSFALALALNLQANHYQITYYLFLLLLVYAIFELVKAVKSETLPTFAKASGALIIGGLLAIGANAAHFLVTYEYSKDTIRGASELTGKGKGGSGLDKDYALAWSYGKLETMNLLIPRFVGGASNESISRDSETAKILRRSNQKGDAGPMYWGAQPFTGGPTYLGAIVCFLFLLGAFLVRGPLKWWLVVASILAILLSWGKNLELFTDLFFYFFPFYNKFRVVSMTLVIVQFTFPLLGMMALHQIMTRKVERAEAMRALYLSGGIICGVILFFMILGGGFLDFEGPGDARYPEIFIDALIKDRLSMLRLDGMRSLILIALAAAAVWAMIQEKLKPMFAIGMIGILILGDLWTVNRRYLSNENFVSAKRADAAFQKTPADNQILSDTDPNFRVLNLTVNTFNNATTSYHHKSIGGYHGAKLRRYQDVIDNHLSVGIAAIKNGLKDPAQAEQVLSQQHVLNMLNMKYLIHNPGGPPIRNSKALGNAWFVNGTKLVNNADEEINAIGSGFDPTTTAVIDKRFENYVAGKTFTKDLNGSIQLTDYKPNHLTYQSNASSEQLAVFSEIYYNHGKGWNAYVDGQLVDHIRANYLLRALKIPAGSHKVEFKFEPATFKMGNFVSLGSSLLLLLGFLGAVFMALKNYEPPVAEEKVVKQTTVKRSNKKVSSKYRKKGKK